MATIPLLGTTEMHSRLFNPLHRTKAPCPLLHRFCVLVHYLREGKGRKVIVGYKGKKNLIGLFFMLMLHAYASMAHATLRLHAHSNCPTSVLCGGRACSFKLDRCEIGWVGYCDAVFKLVPPARRDLLLLHIVSPFDPVPFYLLRSILEAAA